MALQGDLNGIVSIPNASATGDFSVVFSSIHVTGTLSASIIIADNTTSINFIAMFSGGSIKSRINGETTADTSSSTGDVVKYSISRTGTTVTVEVDDVFSSSHEYTGTFILNNFFSYDSGSLKGDMLLSGTCYMTGFTGSGDRLYDFEGSGTTLVDTISGENGTLSGFTTGGFTAPTTSLSVTFPFSNYFKRGDNSRQITIPFNGTCTTTGTVEYSYDNSNWLTLDAAPTGTWSGDVLITQQQNVYLRLSDNVGNVTTLNNLTATDLNIAIALSQSNGAGRLSNYQPITITGSNPVPLLYKEGVYSELVDPTSFSSSVYGSFWPYVAQYYSEQGLNIGLTNIAVGGTKIVEWQQGGTHLNRCEAFASAAGGLDLVFAVIGESDSQDLTPQATFESDFATVATYLNTTYGTGIEVVKFPVGYGTGSTTGGLSDSGVIAIRAAQANLINDYAFINDAGDLSVIDISLGDGVHMTTDLQGFDAGNIVITALSAVFSTANLTATGLGDGTYEVEHYQMSNPLVYVGTENVTFTDAAAQTTIALEVGTPYYTRIDTLTPYVTGVTCIGVTE